MDRTWMERARREKNFTQEQVAKAAGVTTAYYNRLEKGLYTPNVVTGLRVCDFLGLNVRTFLSERPVR
jgi:DNA-binding XRE family transcriptional regulator